MFKEKICKTCGNNFTPSGPGGLYCLACPRPSKGKSAEYTREYQRRKGAAVGVGKGNSPKNKGASHSQYKTGWTEYKKTGRQMLCELGACERCNKDLSNATKWEWVCHHKDHDRTNPARDNLELLCKSCHQIEHQCWKAFEGATTIP